MQHDDDLGPAIQGLAVAGLLVSAVAEVPLVHNRAQSQLPRNLCRMIPAGVIHQDDLIDNLPRNLRDSAFKGFGRLVGRKNDD
jgi:hypothetical protein